MSPGRQPAVSTRRRWLRTIATAVTAGSIPLAGCSGSGRETLPGEKFPTIDEWLTETEVGGADGTYDGVVVDARGRDQVEIDVGVDGNGGTYAFAPSALAVSPGTTIRWVWVDDREGHRVVADPDRQIGKSTYEFESGGPVTGADHEYARTLGEPGLALYHCAGISQTHWERRGTRLSVAGGDRPSAQYYHFEPHRKLGMKGAVAVTE